MGQTLSSPATQKVSESGGNDKFLYAISEMQGWRITMEDAHATVLDLDGEEPSNAFFAVYDGHGGGTVAKFAGQNVHKRLITEDAYKEKQYEAALKKAFLGTDEDLLANPAHTRDPSGCTAVAALITTDNKIYVANAGDSRSVIGVKGEVKPLSFDHKPSSETEKARITAAGGYIEYGRVNGNLALSRAIGDFEFKKNYSVPPEEQVITADPDVTVHDLTDEDEFLVIACDGIWDCLSSQQVVDFVRYQVSEGKELTEIGELMCDHCLAPDTSSGAGIGCDNMTVLIVALLHGRTKEEWYAWVTDRVKNEYGYKTPTTLPQLYAQSRINSFKARREAMEARDRTWNDKEENMSNTFLGSSGLGGFARVLGSTGGISFHPGSGILSDGGHTLMFGDDDDDSEEESGDEELGRSFFSDTLGIGRPNEGEDSTKNLKDQLEQFEQGLREESGELDEDGDSQMEDASETSGEKEGSSNPESSSSKPSGETVSKSTSEEAPPPPKDLPNGSVEQLKSTPGGDEAHPATKAEGFLDASEDPLKGST